jgi:hypothetical protein
MSDFLTRVVWPGVPTDRIKLLRLTLHGAPFRIRTPEDLVQQGARIGEQAIAKMAEDLRRRGLAPLNFEERGRLMHFLQTTCKEVVAKMDTLTTPSSTYQPPHKIRHMASDADL